MGQRGGQGQGKGAFDRERKRQERFERVERACEDRPDATRPPTRVVHQLAFPLEDGEDLIWEIPWRYPTMDDLEKVEHLLGGGEVTLLKAVIPLLTPIKRAGLINQISLVDYNDQAQLFRNFGRRRPAFTGPPQSSDSTTDGDQETSDD